MLASYFLRTLPPEEPRDPEDEPRDEEPELREELPREALPLDLPEERTLEPLDLPEELLVRPDEGLATERPEEGR